MKFVITLSAPWSSTLNEGHFPSSEEQMLSSSSSASGSRILPELMGSTRCLDTAGGLATSIRSTKPQIVISFEILQ